MQKWVVHQDVFAQQVRRVCLCVSALVFAGAVSAQTLTVTLASQPAQPGFISTRSNDEVTLRVASGHAVNLARASGRDYSLEASGGFFWTQVQEIPLNSESIAIKPVIRDDDSIDVALDVSEKQGTRLQQFSTVVNVQPGEWVQILGSPRSTPYQRTKTYGTSGSAGNDTLFLRVSP